MKSAGLILSQIILEIRPDMFYIQEYNWFIALSEGESGL